MGKCGDEGRSGGSRPFMGCVGKDDTCLHTEEIGSSYMGSASDLKSINVK